MEENRLLELKHYLQTGGMPLGRRFASVRLPRHGKMMDIDPAAALAYMEENREPVFTELLFAFIDRTGRKDSEVYKKARIDRRLFSKIRSDKNYTPAKKTVLALCLALELSRADADRLLSAAGYSLSRAEDYDLIIAFCIEKRIFDFFEINEALDHFGFEVFG